MPPLVLPPLSSYAAIMYAALLHVIEAVILLATNDADGSIGMSALLHLIPDRRWLVVALFASSASAFTVLSRRVLSPLLAVLLLVPQQVFLLTTAIAAWLAVWHGSYADYVLRPSTFITADQLPRGVFSLIHLTAIAGIAAYQIYRSRR